jgi:hypothetical protein
LLEIVKELVLAYISKLNLDRSYRDLSQFTATWVWNPMQAFADPFDVYNICTCPVQICFKMAHLPHSVIGMECRACMDEVDLVVNSYKWINGLTASP